MGFQSIRFHGFRNLKDGEVDLNARNIYLVGENGQGKTNFLEALYLLSYGSSFRTNHDKDLISWNRKEMSVSGSFNVAEELGGNLEVFIKEGIKNIRLHGKIVTDRKTLLKRIPTIIFVHDDFLFSSGPPERRRWFIDQTLSLHDSFYVDQLRRYRKILKQRNYLLKMHNLSMLEHYSELLILSGLALVERRENLMQEFGTLFSSLYSEVSGLDFPVLLKYQPSWGSVESTEEITKKFQAKQNLDLALGTTNLGPHRDKFTFTFQGRDFSKSASTGQKRLLSLVLRVAQAQFFSETTGRNPILLLDDVLLELDSARRKLFRERLPKAEQVIYTFLPNEETEIIGDNPLIYRVESGCFYER